MMLIKFPSYSAYAKVNPKKLVKNLKRVENEVNFYRKKFKDKRYIEITYEGITNDRKNSYNKIYDFLKVDILEKIPSPNLKKINPDSLEEIIINFDEIYSNLKGTEFEKFIK